MKLKNTALLLSALFSMSLFSTQAAQEITPEKAANLKPFQRINVTGRFNSIGDATAAAAQRAEQLNAAYFYVQGTSDANNGGNLIVTADLYHENAETVDPVTANARFVNGIRQLSEIEANTLQPFDTVTINGFYPTDPDVNHAITQLAQKKGAASYFIIRRIDVNSSGGNQAITAYIYKADAPKIAVQKPDVIPANSEDGKAVLAKSDKTAEVEKVEIPGVASSSTTGIGRFFETKSSNVAGRYSVTLRDGTKIEELNNEAAKQMQPFDSITISDHFNSMTDMSEAVAKAAAKKGAKFYHITRQWESNSGGNLTVSADLFK